MKVYVVVQVDSGVQGESFVCETDEEMRRTVLTIEFPGWDGSDPPEDDEVYAKYRDDDADAFVFQVDAPGAREIIVR